MTFNPRIAQLHRSGAADGEVPMWDDALDRYVPGDPLGGTPIPTEASDLTTAWVPLQTTVGGVPELVWDGNDELVLVEVPVP